MEREGRRARAWIVAITSIVVGLGAFATGCDKGPKTRVAHPTDQQGIGGAGSAGSRPSEPLEATEIHAEGPVEEGALRGTVRGKISDTGPSLVVITDDYGRRFWFTISTHTVITQDGKPASALALDLGAEVKATFISEEPTGRQVVTRIAVLSAGADR